MTSVPSTKRSSLILRTKLRPPRLPNRVVERPRLFQRLDEGRELPLSLVSAPAGYGKSTLVASWLAHAGLPFGWLSLDETDDDLVAFLSYLVAAIQTCLPRRAPTW